MFRELLARGMFYWLRAPRWHEDVRNDEYMLVIVRLLLSTCALGAFIFREGNLSLDSHEKLLFEYLVYSLIVFAAYRVFTRWHPLFHVAVHCADILFAAFLIVTIGEPGILFVLATFILASATVRWGFWETLATVALLGACVVLIHLCEAAPLLPDHLLGFELVPLVILGSAIAFTAGLLAETKSSRAEAYALSRITREIRLQDGFETAIRRMNFNGTRLFRARFGLAAIHSRKTGQCLLYENSDTEDPERTREIRDLPFEQYFFPMPAGAYRTVCKQKEGRTEFRTRVLREGKIARDDSGFRIPDDFRAAYPFRRLLAASIEFRGEFSIRIFLVDPLAYFAGDAGLRLLEWGLRTGFPIFADLVLAGRLRADAETTAGSRIARDLHDGVIQSLAAINLQLEGVRKKAASVHPQSEDPLVRIQQSVQREIVALRDFTQQLRSYDVDSGNFLGFLSGVAAKFQVEHGIATRFVPEIESVSLQPNVCGELARMVLEALVNVRKHSQASEVLIRLGYRNGDMVISVLDNGLGFGFTGHRTHDELLASGAGPAVIMERAQNIRAKVSIESVEGSGTCLEISLPRK